MVEGGSLGPETSEKATRVTRAANGAIEALSDRALGTGDGAIVPSGGAITLHGRHPAPTSALIVTILPYQDNDVAQ